MNYLTRIRVPLMDAARLRLSDPYAWHQTLWRAFPDRDGQSRDFLTRIDRNSECLEVLILSAKEPTPQWWGKWESKQVPPSFLEHARYRFSLRANPTVKRVVRSEAGNRKKNGRRTAITNPAELDAWIRRKADAAGFSVESLSFDPPVRESFWRKGKSGTHVRVDFHGVLSVTDEEAFRNAFSAGIGPARAFGFGMLLLQPVGE